MGLFQKAIETYDSNPNLIGRYLEGHTPLPPIGHILTRANIEITIDINGIFQSAVKVGKDEEKILIPVTEESGGRSGTKAYEHPHPLCDQLSYLDADKNYYIPQLEEWFLSETSHPFLGAVLKFVKKGKIRAQLENALGNIEEKSLVCWRIIGLEEEPACWKNQKLLQSYVEYYLGILDRREKGVCMATGGETPIALQHPKGIIAINGNAKLISANDSSGFTFRGRFENADDACTVGYIGSQKAHNALRWLAEEQGVRETVGNRIYLCWNHKGKRLPQPFRRMRVFAEDKPIYKPSDYRDALNNTLMGFRKDSQLKELDDVVIASFDAATSGRLSLTYYNEITAKDFLERIWEWEACCCWYGRDGIKSPNLLSLVDNAFGTQRGNFVETDDRIQRQHVQRLLDCKVNGGTFPADIVMALVQRASTPLAFSESAWRGIVFTACAAMQKYYHDTGKGGNEMAWELTRKDRSFQYGRLLAILERAEADYYGKSQETRQTNAIKFMAEYRRRPFFVFERINRMLHQAYLPRIDKWQADRYERLTGEVFSILREFGESELNRPLEDIYLMGYELQRNAFFEKKEKTETEE